MPDSTTPKDQTSTRDASSRQPQQSSTPDNPYQFNDDEKALFNGQDMSTPIARAWSRMGRKGHHFGAPLDSGKTQLNVRSQSFQYGAALMRDEEENKNQTVQFYDARGLVGEESGL